MQRSEAKMNLKHVTILVKDLDESIQFYRDLIDLPVKRRFMSGDLEIAFLGDGETEIELVYDITHTKVSFGTDISLGFEVESLEDALAMMKQKNVVFGDMIQPNPSIRFAFAEDPNGLKIQFVEYIKV